VFLEDDPLFKQRCHRRPTTRARYAIAAAAVGIGTVVSTGLIGLSAPSASAGGTLRQLASAKGKMIGAGVEPSRLASPGPYRDIAAQQFNVLTPGNEMKWDAVEPRRGQYQWSGADQLVNFASANGEKVRGHTLVWHAQLPSWINSGMSAAELRSLLKTHIQTEAGRYKGRIYAWDVVNEVLDGDGTFRKSIWYQKLGQTYVADAFRYARAADPSAKLYINDFNIEGAGAKADGMYRLVRELRQQGVPIDGVGFQSHFAVNQVPSTMRANMQRFAALGLDVAITELDVRIKLPTSAVSLSDQANDYKSVVDNCVAITRCVGVTVWGITDKYSWIPGVSPGYGAALMWDENYAPKKAYTYVQRAFGG
jgi:GH35 family endo-1,4-beta-xylanase